MTTIETRNLTVTFGRTLALRSLDLSIGAGVTGLFGQNGSGKTTLLRVVSGLLRPTSGSVSVGGVDPRALDEDARRHVGYVGHKSGMYERLTLHENLEVFARLYDVDPGRIQATLDSLDLGPWRNASISELSAGLKRRAAVARAVLHDPRYLFLDEPFANLDDEAAETVSRVLTRWNAPDRCALIATHGAKRVKRFARAGVILQRGTLVTHGSYVGAEA